MSTDLMLRLEVQAMLDLYIDVIDNDRLEEWPALFIEDCLYEIMPRENEDMGLPAPVMRCDNQRMLRDRVISLRNANIFSPQTYRHFLSGLVIQSASDTAIAFTSNYLVVNSNQAGQSLVYQTGRYSGTLVKAAEGWRFSKLRCVFETSRVQTLLAIPI